MFVSNQCKVPAAEFSGVLRLTVLMDTSSNVCLNLYEPTKAYVMLNSVKN